MKRSRTTTTIVTAISAAAIASAACLGGIAGAGRAAAAGDPFVGMQVLDLLCESKGGTAYQTPYTISRCQAARDAEGFEIERLVCEGLLGARFAWVETVGRPHRVNWFCIPGATA
jgi:hypothetical protein